MKEDPNLKTRREKKDPKIQKKEGRLQAGSSSKKTTTPKTTTRKIRRIRERYYLFLLLLLFNKKFVKKTKWKN